MANLVDTASSWLAARGSVIGQGHIKHNLKCQDANAWLVLPENPAWGVAVVSDGAGSCANSDRGSERIATKASELFTDLLRRQGWADGEQLPDTASWTDMARATLRAVADDLRFYADSQSLDFHSLSATVIVVVFGPIGLLVANVGDGRAAAQRLDGSWQAIMTPFRGEEVNATVFLTSNIWAPDRVDKFVGADVYRSSFRAFALLSDGCEMATFALSRFDEDANRYESLNEPYPPFFDPNVAALIGLHKQRKTEDEINQLWKQLLTNGIQRLADEPDDKTIILAVNLKLIDVPIPATAANQVTEAPNVDGAKLTSHAEVVEPIPVPELEKLKAEIQPAFTAPKQEVKKIIVQRGGTGKLKQQKQDKYKKHRK